jgi:hypothetical protein
MEMKRSSTRGEPDVLVEKVAKTASEEIEWRNKKMKFSRPWQADLKQNKAIRDDLVVPLAHDPIDRLSTVCILIFFLKKNTTLIVH